MLLQDVRLKALSLVVSIKEIFKEKHMEKAKNFAFKKI